MASIRTPNTPVNVRQARSVAEDLAQWSWLRLVNRTDAWGGYWRQQADNGLVTVPTTRPHPRDRGKVLLTPVVIVQHFRASQARHVIGLHSTSPHNTSKWGGVDIDWHGPTSTASEVNLAVALAWFDRLRALGFHPLLLDSNGKGGFHLWTLFSEPAPTSSVFGFLKWLTRDHAAHGLPMAPEIFPKQSSIKPGGCGNWLRLPGRHHTREHWSKAWDGSRWLPSAGVAAFILALTGDSPSLIPAEAVTPAATAQAPPHRKGWRIRTPAAGLSGRIAAYLAKLPSGLGEGQHRDDYAFSFACFLVRDLQLSNREALAWLQEWDRRQQAPKGEARLEEIIRNAHQYGKHAYGSGLRADRHGHSPLRHVQFTVRA
jgi:hypothetical protein